MNNVNITLMQDYSPEASLAVELVSSKRRASSRVTTRAVYLEQGIHTSGSEDNSIIYVHEDSITFLIDTLVAMRDLIEV